MPDYKASSVTGEISKWTRCNKIEIVNKYGYAPALFMHEEEMTSLPDGSTQSREVPGVIVKEFVSPDESFALLDPTTGAVLGTATHGQLYALVYSLYFDLATKRDLALNPPPPEE